MRRRIRARSPLDDAARLRSSRRRLLAVPPLIAAAVVTMAALPARADPLTAECLADVWAVA
jgi:hypothetical protein